MQGLFFKELDTLSDYLKPLTPYLRKLKSLALESKLTLQELALAYVFNCEFIDYILIGIETTQQLDENIASISKVKDIRINTEVNKINVKETELLNPTNWK